MVVAVAAHKIAYLPVPKAACTSVKAALASIDPQATDASAPRFKADVRAVHLLYPTRRHRPKRWRRYEGWFRFTVVRDPLQRMLSLYSDLIAGRRILHNSPRLRRGRAPLPLDPDPDMFFLNLAAYIEWASVVKHHALPMWLYTGLDLDAFDRVYRIGEMDALRIDLDRVTGRKVTIPRLNESRARLDFATLRAETQAALRARLEPEYAFLGDYFDRPWAPAR